MIEKRENVLIKDKTSKIKVLNLITLDIYQYNNNKIGREKNEAKKRVDFRMRKNSGE